MDTVARHWIDGVAHGRPEADSLDGDAFRDLTVSTHDHRAPGLGGGAVP